MAFDGIYLSSIIEELKQNIENSKVDKINQPEKDEIIITFRKDRNNFNLLLSTSSNYPKIHFTALKKNNPQVPPQFCMVLRKYLAGSQLLQIEQIDFDRKVKLTFEGTDDFGFHSLYNLYMEIMGRHSNLTLVRNRDNKVIDCIKHITPEINSFRVLLPGVTYVAPPSSNKLNPSCFNNEDVLLFINNNNLPKNKNLFMKVFTGVSSPLSSHVYNMYKEQIEAGKLEATINYLKSIIIGEKKYITYNMEDKPYDFYCLPLSIYDNFTKMPYHSPSAQVEDFYLERDKYERLSVKSSSLQKVLNTNIERVNKKIQLFNNDLEEAKEKEQYRIKGELLTSNIYSLKRGMTEITLLNYYNNEKVTIPLIINKTPSENVQYYYKKYNKLKKTEEAAAIQINIAQEELNYLQSVLTLLLNVDTYTEIDEIKRELCLEGYIKNTIKIAKKVKPAKPAHFVTKSDVHIFVGKNNFQNDYLTLKFAEKKDLWFHTKNIPGSHVIIKNHGNITEETILEAANLAAYYSHAKDSTKVPVDYTEVKNVKKPSGAKPGMVIYSTNKTIYVTPKAPTIQKIE